MTTATYNDIRWVPFGVLTLVAVIATGFWKINKSMESPIPRLSEMQDEGSNRSGHPPPSKMEGKHSPHFTLPALGGGEISIADYKGKVVLLNFWATWCPPCKEEMPSMQKLYDHFKGRDFEMVTVSIDEDTSLVQPFMDEMGLTFPAAFDPDSAVGQQYGLTGVPETFLIDKSGTIIHHLVGPGDWFDPGLVSALESIIDR